MRPVDRGIHARVAIGRRGSARILPAATVLAVRRWVCEWPWSDQCLAQLGNNLETAILFLWVDDWEALVAAMLALSAATLGAYLLHRQIEETRRAERKRLARRFRAVKAALPMVLSDICEWAKGSAEAWLLAADTLDASIVDQVIPESMGGTPRYARENVRFPPLPPNTVNDIQAMIEASNRTNGQPFICLLEKLQVRVTRSREFHANFNDPSSEKEYSSEYCRGEVIEAAEVYAVASSQFAFARNDDVDVALAAEDVRSSLFLMGIRSDTHEAIYARVARLFPAREPEGLQVSSRP